MAASAALDSPIPTGQEICALFLPLCGKKDFLFNPGRMG
jgi:hypothetical protein